MDVGIVKRVDEGAMEAFEAMMSNGFSPWSKEIRYNRSGNGAKPGYRTTVITVPVSGAAPIDLSAISLIYNSSLRIAQIAGGRVRVNGQDLVQDGKDGELLFGDFETMKVIDHDPQIRNSAVKVYGVASKDSPKIIKIDREQGLDPTHLTKEQKEGRVVYTVRDFSKSDWNRMTVLF